MQMNTRQHLSFRRHRSVASVNLEIPALWLFPHGPLTVCFSSFHHKTHTYVYVYVYAYVCMYNVAHAVLRV